MARWQVSKHQASGLALPLALVYCGLVAYASLYPFTGWQSQGIMPWAFVFAPLPRYWSGFDLVINVLGYLPLGVLTAIAWQAKSQTGRRHIHGIWFATAFACALSFAMESLQIYLSPRVASNVDWALNTLGGFLGGSLAWMLESLGLLKSWSRFREQRFGRASGLTLGLLVLWPLALLYPTSIPLGLGHGLGQWLELDTQVLPDKVESIMTAIGLCLPALLGFAIVPALAQRMVLLALVVTAALGVTTLSNGLSFGPEHAAVWLHPQTLWGLWLGAAGAAVCLVLKPRLCWVAMFLLIVPQIAFLSIMASDPYFTQTLGLWERGQWIRFYGATQWLGWLWPYAVLVLAVSNIGQHKN